MLILSVLLSTLVWAQDGLIERYCFENRAEALKAQTIIQQVIIPQNDRVSLENNCLDVMIHERRIEIVEKWLKQNYRKNFSKTYVESTHKDWSPHCELDIKIVKAKKSVDNNVVIGYPSKLSQENQASLSTSQYSIMGQSLKPISLQIDETAYEIICQLHSSGKASIKLQTHFKPQVYPALYAQSPSQEILLVSTEVDLQKGEEMELAHLIQELKDQSKKISLERGLEWKDTSSHDTKEFKIRLK